MSPSGDQSWETTIAVPFNFMTNLGPNAQTDALAKAALPFAQTVAVASLTFAPYAASKTLAS
jgi:hypothetical protein